MRQRQKWIAAVTDWPRRLADELGMPADRRDQALARLRDAFLHGKISAFSKDASLNGITRAITSCTLSLW